MYSFVFSFLIQYNVCEINSWFCVFATGPFLLLSSNSLSEYTTICLPFHLFRCF